MNAFQTVIVLAFIVLLVVLAVQRVRISELREKLEFVENASIKLRKEKEKLSSDMATLNEKLSHFGSLERKEAEIKELIEQEQVLARLSNPSASRAKLAYLSSFDELGIQYGYSRDGNELQRAVRQVQTLYYSGECVRSTTAAPLAKGAAACLLDSLNGFASGQIEKAKTGKYDLAEIIDLVKDSFLMANIRGRSAMHAEITKEYLDAILNAIHWADAVLKLKQAERDEQRYLAERRKEEARATAEIERQVEEAKRTEENLQWEYEKAVRAYEKNPSNENKRLVAELKEKCRAASLRVKSLAEMLKKGTVYILSNIGSFGENIYKIGMSRRINPKDRVDELSSASVPFPFDIHAFIETQNAPELESKLHSMFFDRRVNVASVHKEFFNVTIEEIRTVCDRLGLRAEWTMVAKAEQYRESIRLKNSPSYKEMLARQRAEIFNVDHSPYPLDDSLSSAEDVPSVLVESNDIDKANTATNHADPVKKYAMDEYLSMIHQAGISFSDKRDVGGCLWILDSDAAKPYVEGVLVDGEKPVYVKSSRALKGKPGWYLN